MKVDGKRQYDLLEKMGFVRVSGSPEELKAAHILMDAVKEIGFEATLEPFDVADGTVPLASFEVIEPEYRKYTVTGYKCAKCTAKGGEEYDFMYMEQFDDVMVKRAKGKFVLVNGRVTLDIYKKLIDAGVAGFMTMGGTVIDEVEKTDLDTRKIRDTYAEYGLLPAFHIRMIDALEILKSKATKVRIELETKNHIHTSHNVVVTVPGTEYPDEIIDIGAHYDSVEFSYGVWDNAAGSVTIMEMLRYFAENPPKRTLRFIWFGSEELGLLGSKAYVEKYANELDKHVFMINVDVGGSILGQNNAVITADEGLCKYVEYLAKEVGYSTGIRHDIMSSDSTPFADKGIPAINFARGGGGAGSGMGFMHTRYDMISLISADALQVVTEFAVTFADKIVNAVVFPVPKKLPQVIIDKVDKYLAKKKD